MKEKVGGIYAVEQARQKFNRCGGKRERAPGREGGEHTLVSSISVGLVSTRTRGTGTTRSTHAQHASRQMYTVYM